MPGKRQLVAVICALVFSVAVVAAGNIPLSKSVVAPGTVESLSKLVSVAPVNGDERGLGYNRVLEVPAGRPLHGDIRLVTVRTWRATIADLAYAAVRSDIEVVEDPTINDPEEQRDKRRTSQLVSSELVAQFVAAKAAGIQVTPTGSGALVEDATTEPASRVLAAGDVITEVAGVPVRVAEEIRGALARKSPGDVVGISFVRGTDSLRAEVTLSASPGEPHRALLGVLVSTLDLRLDSPFRVEFDLGGIGGPSAGLALALEVYARLTGKDLTGPATVVATGELQLDGRVLAVGGVAQKARAASVAGADVMVVPAANAEEARRYAGEVAVVGVGSFEEAVSVLSALAQSE